MFMPSSLSVYVVGKKKGDKEPTRKIIDRKRKVRLLKLKYMAVHKAIRKAINPADIFQLAISG
jgi:hypothetical protein